MDKKLIAQGPINRRSYTLTLPLEWVKSNNLENDKVVDFKIIENKCIISSLEENVTRHKVDSKIFESIFLKFIPTLYKMGVEEIEIKHIPPKKVSDVSQIIENKLIGFEIMDQTINSLLIKDISGESNKNFHNVFRRLFRLMIELSRCEDKYNIMNLTKNIEKLINYCQRILVKNPSEYKNQIFLFNFLAFLEGISDQYKWLFLKTKISGKVSKDLTEINECLQKAYELYYKFDEKHFVKYQYESYQLILKLSNNTDIASMYLQNIARQVNNLYSNLFALRQV